MEGFEQYLRRAFLGQKQFSLEGLDVMVPMLDEAIELAVEDGAHEVVIGMAHRGRLNVLDARRRPLVRVDPARVRGRALVRRDRRRPGGRLGRREVPPRRDRDAPHRAPARSTVTVAANPSHLEAVDPVVEGRARAEQTDRSSGCGIHDPSVAHADPHPRRRVVRRARASWPRRFNLQNLEGYSTGGTLHLIGNNQVGFTTDPMEGRSTRYSSDLAKGFDVPIIHVNADDPEAAVAAIRLAMAYRREFGHDVVVDLVGYRRFGHNEQDEAAYTQPLMVEQIAEQPTARQQYAARLIADRLIDEAGANALVEDAQQELRSAHERLKASLEQGETPDERVPRSTGDVVHTAVPADRLTILNDQLLALPDGFAAHPKLAKQLERRLETVREGGIDWGQAEALAFASLLEDGIPIRLSGQDTERGTFSHRHLVLHDPGSGEMWTPMQHLPGATASFEVYNSPLSEYAALGFEYGYSIAAPDTLVLWEAQFGDFVNGAQIVVDQFLVAGLSKWGQTSRLTLLLPHGYEGNGPEHSSARLERFLQLAAQENVRIANCTTAAQFFHLLRRQALDATARPLVVMTPKGLLRLKQATSSLDELAGGSFRPVIADAGADPRSGPAARALLGEDLLRPRRTRGARERDGRRGRRLEQLYPFPVEAAAELCSAYPHLQRARVGAGGAAEHGRVADDPPPARERRPVGRARAFRRPAVACEHRPRATRRRICVEQDRIVRQALGRES